MPAFPGRAPGRRTARRSMILSAGAGGGDGDPTWGARHDLGFSPARAERLGNLAPGRDRSEDGAQIHRARPGAAELWAAPTASAAAGAVRGVSAAAGHRLSGPHRQPIAARDQGTRLWRWVHRRGPLYSRGNDHPAPTV